MSQRLLSMQRSSATAKTAFVVVLAAFLIFFLPGIALAQADSSYGLSSFTDSGLGTTNLIAMIANIVRWILGVLGVLAVLLVLYAGFIWMTAGGDTAKIAKAKAILKNAIIGLIIIFSSFSIASFLVSHFSGQGGGNGQPTAPGSPGDFGRWGIGAGPIESVYPAPGQSGVSIDTGIIVTFKEPIDPSTIGAGGAMKNAVICKLDDENKCEEETDFSSDKFIGSTVAASADNKTFTFTPSKNLGNDDSQIRRFQVQLTGDIKSAKGEDIFARLSGNLYKWSFSTNGKIDLDPPELLSLTTGVYPSPDASADTYTTASVPTPTKFSITADAQNIKSEITASYTAVATTTPNTPSATLSGTYIGDKTGTVTVTIGNGNAVNVAGAIIYTGTYNTASKNITICNGCGLTFTLSSVAADGNRWTFSVTAHQAGDKLQVLNNGQIAKEYVFGTLAAGITELTTSDSILKTCGSGENCVLQTVATGLASTAYDLKFTGSSDAITVERHPGADAKENQTANGARDAFRNTVFQINFNEAINPAMVDKITVKYDKNNDGAPDESVNNAQIEISNQYRTIELRGPDECGVNSCGKKIYCWPVGDKVNNKEPDATKYTVEIPAVPLMPANDAKCNAWGGKDIKDFSGSTDMTTHRCAKTIGSKTVFYPKAGANVFGIVDMANNSFNGGFNTSTDSATGKEFGLANGQIGSSDGQSNLPAYKLENGSQASDNFGDNLTWSFYLSSQIDKDAPLIEKVNPAGDAQVEKADQAIEITFDRLMRSATLKSGWGYGATQKDKDERYVALQALAGSPIGYWVSKINVDINNDNWAEKTIAKIEHNQFSDATQYGPLVGSGVESITQNCFLPSAGPKEAGKDGQSCSYDNGLLSTGCAPVNKSNPASYGYLNCKQIQGADECANSKVCMASYFDKEKADTYLGGSWVITKDFSNITAPTGCCFGSCQNISDLKTCADLKGVAYTDNSKCVSDEDKPGIILTTKVKDENETEQCCYGKISTSPAP